MKQLWWLGFLWGCCTSLLWAQNQDQNDLLTIQRIFDSNDFKVKRPEQIQWLEGTSDYTKLVDACDVNDGKDIVRFDPQTAKSQVLVAAHSLIPGGQSTPLAIEGYQWSQDQTKLLIFTHTHKVWRYHTRGDYWVFDLKTHTLSQIAPDADPGYLMFAKFNPKADSVAYVYRGDLYVERLKTHHIRALTRHSSPTIINGTSDWVNEEELGVRDGYRWSPDSKTIAYWQFDTSDVNMFTLINNTSELYPKVFRYPYPKAGTTNSACRVGVVQASGGRTSWIKIPGDLRNHYIPALEWIKGTHKLIIQQLNRLQNTHRLFICQIKTDFFGNARAVRPHQVFVDWDKAWVNPDCRPHWIEQGRAFLWLSERDGWNHLYRVDLGTGDTTLLSPGDYDIIKLLCVDEKHHRIYVTASPNNPSRCYLYQIPLSGGPARRVTPPETPGWHRYDISPNGDWAIHTFSTAETPPRTELIQLPEHRVNKVLEDNDALRKILATLPPCPVEFFNLPIDDKIRLPGWIMKPPAFDPQRQYPLLFLVYGEPAGQTVLDRWMGQQGLWHRMLAQQGILVASIDNRGTPAPLGRSWRKCIYRQVGILASADQADAARTMLKKWSFIDPNHLGIWGWSGGGSMTLNAMFRYPDLYRMGMAVAFVSDMHYYDTIYQERYMGLPSDNEEGYKNGSPITFARQLKGHLLLVYGTGDDNCHFQNCEALINRLVKYDKPFDLMIYPNRRHGLVAGKNTRRHLYELLTRYVHEHLLGP